MFYNILFFIFFLRFNVMEEILKKDWTDDEREIIVKMKLHLNTYNYFIPKNVKDDIYKIIEMACRIKENLELLKCDKIEEKVEGKKEEVSNVFTINVNVNVKKEKKRLMGLFQYFVVKFMKHSD